MIQPLVAPTQGPVGFRLSPQQRHLWRLGLAALPARCTLLLQGRLHREMLDAALDRVVDRFEILRTTFLCLPGLKFPVQVIAERGKVSRRFVDLGSLAGGEAQAQVDAVSAREASMPFDLERGPVLRATLLALDRERHALLLALPTLTADRVTLHRLGREIAREYAFLCGGADAGGEPLQYADFAEWRNEMSENGRDPEHGSPVPDRPPPSLPFERRAVGEGEFHRQVLPLAVAPGEIARLSAAAEARGCSLEDALLAGWQALLWRLCTGAAPMLGLVCDGRGYEEIEGVLGPCEQSIPLTCDFDSGIRFSELMRRSARAAAECREFQHSFSWDVKVEAGEIAAEHAFLPFLFEFEEEEAEWLAADLSISAAALDVANDRFRMKLLAEQGSSLSLEYDGSLFDADDAAEVAGCLQAFLESAAADPEAPLSELSLLGREARDRLLRQWNDTARDYPRDRCLHELFEVRAVSDPQRLAVVLGDAQMSRGELSRSANRLAYLLRERGVRPEVVVAVCCERSLAMVVAVLGVLKAGGAYLPLDPELPAARLTYLLEQSGATIVLTQEQLLDRLRSVRTEILCLDRNADLLAGRPEENLESLATPDNLAYLTYTSGTTGTPKGVASTHRGAVAYLSFVADAYGLGADDRILQLATLSFDASVRDLLGPLAAGATVVLVETAQARDPVSLLAAIEEQGITRLLSVVPSLLRVLMEAAPEDPSRYRTLCTILTSGERLYLADCRRAWQTFGGGVEIVNQYGPTECTMTASYHRVDDAAEAGPVAWIGRPIGNMRFYVLGEGGDPVPVRVPGELYIGGTGLTRGYFKAPGLTAERFVPNPFGPSPGERLYATGDLVRWLQEGNLEFLGRRDHQVKIRGYRVEPAEVEATLLCHLGVREAVVVAREDEPGEPCLIAYVVLDRGTKPSLPELRRFLEECLPQYMVPTNFVPLAALPLTPNGKVDLRALPAPEEAAGSQHEFVPLRTVTEEILAQIWVEVLGTPSVGAGDNFFHLGGHSLLATQVVARARKLFSVELPLQAIFEYPTVAELAAVVDGQIRKGVGLSAPPLGQVPRDGHLLLSFAQERLWFLDQLQPGSSAYNIPAVVRLVGRLAVPALAASLGEIVRRHEVLRTTFAAGATGPVQVVASTSRFVLPEVDLTGLGQWLRDEEAQRLTIEETRRPFDLAQGPLLRARLLRLGAEEHLALLTQHHIVSDAWSIGVFVRELGALYSAFAAGNTSPLAELTIQYADYASWQREWLRGEALEQQVAYWRERLEGAPSLLELPADRPRPPVPSLRGGRVALALPAEGMRALARQQGVTLFMVLLAGVATLLSRLSGQEDLSLGSPIAGRSRRETEDLIGFFVNTLVLRVELKGDPSFGELLRRVREVSLGAYAHQDLPFEKLVEELSPERSLAHAPLFQVMLVLQNAPKGALNLSGLDLSPVALENRTVKFDLTLSLMEVGQELAGSLEYARDLFDATTMVRLVGQFERLLLGLAAEPEQRVWELELLSEVERQQLVEWNDTRAFCDERGACLHRWVEAQVARTPDAVAVVFESSRLSYSELNSRADRLGGFLRRLGVGPDVPVGICAERSLELVIGLLGILKSGGAYVPLDPSYPSERLAQMVEDAAGPAGTLWVLTGPGLADRFQGLGREGEPRFPAVRVADLPRVCQESSGARGEDPRENPSPDQLAYVIFTSGSTGRPKGAANTHRAIVNRLLWMQDAYGLTSKDRVLQKTPMSFDVSVWEFFWPLLSGASLALAQPEGHKDSTYLVNLIAQEDISTLHFVPSMLQVFLEEPSLARCGSLRRVIASGEALSAELARRFFERLPGVDLHNLYGPTEAAVDVTFHPCRPGAERAIPIGRPITNLGIYVLDRARGTVPLGIPGELCIGGVGLARGYLLRPDLTAERFVPHPASGEPGTRLYRTGDRARFLPSGEIEYLGRLDFQVKMRGLRIELGEIEYVLGQHPGVREVVVLAREDRPGDRRLVGYLVPSQGQAPATEELRDFLKHRLPEYMTPSTFLTLAAVPLSPNGKVDRRALPVPDTALLASEGEAPKGGGLEEAIATAWRDVLGLSEVGATTNFFDAGGHSLLLLQLRARLQQAGLEVSILDLFRYPTIRSLANLLGEPEEPTLATFPRLGEEREGTDIAIIGMSGCFPGAANVEELWRNLRAGVESINFFSAEELRSAEVNPRLLDDPRYVRARGALAGHDFFDAAFFGYTAREAQWTDPQQRVFLERAWEALEDAGYDPDRVAGRIAVYAGSSSNTYLFNVLSHRDLVNTAGAWPIMLGNRNDFLTTRVSYKLNLRGRSVTVQTACSTSLVAVCLACESLLEGESDMVLAGGVSIAAQQRIGYIYEEGGIASPDGHTRAFDARGRGTVSGSGAGIVVLKRLKDALRDGDCIRSVIKGTGLSNDGSLKAGFTAPSVEGQAEAIGRALAKAGVPAESIGYVEAHGTGTRLGDPIEIAGLKRGFGLCPSHAPHCAIGSIKTNIGHLDAAAGVAGLIKASLALAHREILPSLHFESPNPEIDFESSPFYVNTSLRDWPAGSTPRRAGVSSFGIGGTNAHVILEEAPEPRSCSPSRPWQLILLSARTASALARAAENLTDHLRAHPEAALADVAYTLAVGRKVFSYRHMVVAASREEAATALAARPPQPHVSSGEEVPGREVAFLFPGQGTQQAGMASALYAGEASFRRWVDLQLDLLTSHLDFDLRRILLSGPEDAESSRLLEETAVAQPALFVVEYALAQLWMEWGIRPRAMLGHSIGEYVAACLAGVFSLEDALALVAARGRLLQALPPGAMLSVPLSEAEIVPRLDRTVSLAAVNSARSSVVSGPPEAILALAEELTTQGLEVHRLRTSRAFHSSLTDAALDEFATIVAKVNLKPPAIPYLSNVTGAWIGAAEAIDPGYWVRHLRQTVRFAAGIDELLARRCVLLEVGPGNVLTILARQQASAHSEETIIPSLRNPRDPRPDLQCLLAALGALWLLGVEVDWPGFYASERRYRVPLPTYPFERQRFWVEYQRARLPGTEEDRPVDWAPESLTESTEPEREGDLAPASYSPLEEEIAGLWRDLLGVSRVNTHDNFFELGGNSVTAVRLGSRLRERFGAQLSADFLLEAPTIAGIAERVAEALARCSGGESKPPRDGCLVEIQKGNGSTRRPLFLIHPVGGHVLYYRSLARTLGGDQPVYGLRAYGLAEGEGILSSVEELAAHYVGLVRARQAVGPYLLGGSSMGGLLAYEMAQQLLIQGQETSLLAMMDTAGPEQAPQRPKDAAELLLSLYGHWLPISSEAVRQLAPEAQINYVVDLIRNHVADLEDLAVLDIRRHMEVVEVLWRAMLVYRPRPYPGRILFLRAKERSPLGPTHPELVWTDLAEFGTNIRVVPGGHTSMLLPPNLPVLAGYLKRAINGASIAPPVGTNTRQGESTVIRDASTVEVRHLYHRSPR